MSQEHFFESLVPDITASLRNIERSLATGQAKGTIDALNSGGAVTATVASQIIMQQNELRNIASIVNDSLVDVYLALGGIAIVGSGIVLKAGGGSFTFGRLTDFPWLGSVSVVCALTANVVFTEC